MAAKTRYPQGAEKQLIQRATGRQVPPGGLPADVGCAVFNVSTAYAVYEAVCLGRPLIPPRASPSAATGWSTPATFWSPSAPPAAHRGPGGRSEGRCRLGPHGRPHDGHRPVRPVRPHDQGDQRPDLHDRRRARPCGGGSHLHPLRQMHRGMSHAPGDHVHQHVYHGPAYEETDKFHVTDCIECAAAPTPAPPVSHWSRTSAWPRPTLRAWPRRQRVKEAKRST